MMKVGADFNNKFDPNKEVRRMSECFLLNSFKLNDSRIKGKLKDRKIEENEPKQNKTFRLKNGKYHNQRSVHSSILEDTPEES